jgi:hypothetical protein
LTEGVVDLLVVTHEHLDHVSGFAQAEDEFDNIEIRNIWFAWTENGRDKLAQELKQKYGKVNASLKQACRLLAAMENKPEVTRQRLAALNGVLAFDGESALAVASAAAGERDGGLGRAMDNLKRWAGELESPNGTQYLKPGRCLPLPDAAASSFAGKVRAYVLGPPHDAAEIRHANPSAKNPETYEKKVSCAAAMGSNWVWASAVAYHEESKESRKSDVAFDRSQPFDEPWRMPWSEAKKDERFFIPSYFGKGLENDIRRIEDDWLWNGARALALRVSNYTNNTSLVLAFELPQSGKVLLFAADAQVGNWLSWHDQDYTSRDGQKVTAEDLLKRTVLYKVGHHGSHNATLRERGLELMLDPELTAMLPVEVVAAKRLRYHLMPLPGLVEALNKRCADRVLQLDKPFSGDRAPGEWRGLIRPVASTETIPAEGGQKERPLYVEYTIRD